MASIQLQGKIFIIGEIEATTGLHIGGSAGEWTSAVWITLSSETRSLVSRISPAHRCVARCDLCSTGTLTDP